MFGHKEGKAGTENKHELPPPLDNELCFGDILVLLCKDKKSFAKPIAFKPEEYEAFYTQMFEGFEDLDDEDEEENEFEDEEEEEEDDLAEEKEAEFEENEENEYEEDEEVVEEKPEYEEEPPPVVQRKKPTKAEKAAAKSKKKDTAVPFQIGEELTAELETTSLKEKQRIQTRSAISKILAEYLSEEEQNELEHHIYNASLFVADKKHITKHWSQPLFVEIYKALSRTVIGNLSPANYVKNQTLYKRYKEGAVSLAEIAHFNFSDLYPEIWKELSIRQFEREKRQLEGNKSMATDQFQCKRCGKRECTYYELQTRSADEPMTIFIQCVNCGKHWRQ